jgi:hypothetical protein
VRFVTATRWSVLAIQGVLALALLVLLYLVGTRGVAAWYAEQPKPQGLQKAIEWNPANPDYHRDLGHFFERDSEQGSLPQAILHYQKATDLNPRDARAWADLGGAYELTGQLEKAQSAYEQAARLFPQSPEINWRLANYYIRQGELEKAVRALRAVMNGSYALRQQAFDLAWRAGLDPELVRTQMIPPDTRFSFQYLTYLAQQNHMQEATQVWQQILASPETFGVTAAFPYLDGLIKDQRVDELQAAWKALSERNPTLLPHRSFDPNLMCNGDFESRIFNGGLDWRVRPAEGVLVKLDSLKFFDGTHSLQIHFNGKHNVSYAHISQYVPVKPNTLYRFTGYMQTQGITTDSGPSFQIYDAYDPSRLNLLTEPLLGTNAWTARHLEFSTPPETRLLLIRVVRRPSQKLDNQIAGTAWIDRVSLQAVE